MKTLATESASDTFTGNRATLDTEYQTLLGEINRQAGNIGLSATHAPNATLLSVYIGGGQSAVVRLAGVRRPAPGQGGFRRARPDRNERRRGAAPVTDRNGGERRDRGGRHRDFHGQHRIRHGILQPGRGGRRHRRHATHPSESARWAPTASRPAWTPPAKLAFSSNCGLQRHGGRRGLAGDGDRGINTDLNNQQVTYVTVPAPTPSPSRRARRLRASRLPTA